MRIIKGSKLQSVSREVKIGLTAKRKSLPPWLLMDGRGDELIKEFKKLPEHYFSSCEHEVISTYSDAIAYNLADESKKWSLIEFSPSVAAETIFILSAFNRNRIQLEYIPIHISESVLELLQSEIQEKVNGVEVKPVQSQHLEGLTLLQKDLTNPSLFMMLGDTIGNMEMSDAAMFLKAVSSRLKSRDRMLISFDLMKSPPIIERSVHDQKGISSSIHLNVLNRINEELGGDFNLKDFEHWPLYDAVSGACRNYLVSSKRQVVNLNSINLEIQFNPWETIDTGVLQKYSEETLEELVGVAGLTIEKKLFDQRRYVSLVLLRSI